VTKDFATEPNEETLRQAAHRMAQKLAGSLALVTCKEPLRSNLSSHIRQFLGEQGFTEVCLLIGMATPPDVYALLQQIAPDQVVLLLVQDNIELACRAIEKAAMDRAVADVDENFAPSYELRRRHRQVMTSPTSCLAPELIFASLGKPWSALLGCICAEFQLLWQPA